jgi:S-ribosylhomocysteine lyase
MEKIASFTIDHIKLQPGLYVSRQDRIGAETVTTFDLRITSPNEEPVMNTAEIHAMEHLGATYLRNNELWKDHVIYFGPMGCRTGFYLLVRDEAPERVLDVVIETLRKIVDHGGEMFGATRKECGNYQNLSLAAAKVECEKYLTSLKAKNQTKFEYGE